MKEKQYGMTEEQKKDFISLALECPKEEVLELVLRKFFSATKDFCMDMWQDSFMASNLKKEFGKQGRDEVEAAIILALAEQRTYIKGMYYLVKDMESLIFGNERADDNSGQKD